MGEGYSNDSISRQVFAGLRIRIILMRIRIQLFTLMRIRIRIRIWILLMQIRLRIQLLFKVRGIRDLQSIDPPGLYFELLKVF
jgi:hypothetical protein